MEVNSDGSRGGKAGIRGGGGGGRGLGGLGGNSEERRGQPTVRDGSVDVSSLVLEDRRKRRLHWLKKKKMKKMLALEKKNMARLPADQRARLQEPRERKKDGPFLMPDVPPIKKRSKVSPTAVPCPVIPGIQEVTPPLVPQPGDLKTSALDTSGRSKVELEKPGPTPQQINELFETLKRNQRNSSPD